MRPNARHADRGQDRGAAEREAARMTRTGGEITGIAAAGSLAGRDKALVDAVAAGRLTAEPDM